MKVIKLSLPYFYTQKINYLKQRLKQCILLAGLLCFQELIAQKQIIGTVKDKNQIPLSEVTVLIKGKHKQTQTNKKGFYTIQASSNDVLVFSYIGFLNKEIRVGNRDRINITLQEQKNINKIGEVTIYSTGYEKVSAERTTGSFQKIDQNKLDTKIYKNILSKLKGEVPGIVFDSKYDATIRGVSTINAYSKPLIVVDGFPIQNISSINPNDVESVTVLEDAAAASIWGIRASNGVIVITTKSGKKNSKPIIEFFSNFSVHPKQNYKDLPYASTQGYLEFSKLIVQAGYIRLGGQYPVAYPLALQTYAKLKDGTLSEEEAGKIISRLAKIDSRQEFDRLFRKNALWQQYGLAMQGGGKNSTYRTSITYNGNNNSNSYAGNNSEEIIANYNHRVVLSDKIEFSSIINFNRLFQRNNGMAFSDLDHLPQYQRILDSYGQYVAQARGLDQSYKDKLVKQGYPYNWNYNLKQEFDNKNNKINGTSIRFNTKIKYKLTDYISFFCLYQYESSQENSKSLYNENTYKVRSTINRFTVTDDKGSLVSSVPKGEVINKAHLTEKTHAARFQFNLDKSFQKGLHKVNAILGYEVRQELIQGDSFERWGYNPRSLQYKDAPYGQTLKVVPYGTMVFTDGTSFTQIENRFFSYYVNAAYTYHKKYTLSASTRLDDCNLFGASKKYRNIPLYSVGGKWDIHKEFLLDNQTFNHLSLRVTYGSNGNVDRSTSPFLKAEIGKYYKTGLPYAYISSVKNPDLRLEKTFVTNLGIDFGLFHNLFSGSIEYYSRKSKDLLSTVAMSSTLGFSSALINAGEMENHGLNLNLNALVVKSKNFKYHTALNFSYNTNEVTKVEVPSKDVKTYLEGQPLKGKPIHYLYSYNYAGLDAKGYPQAYNENHELIGAEAEITSPYALIYNGSTDPKYYGGWINNFSYKNFSLRILTTYKLAYVFRNTNILSYKFNYLSEVGHIHKDFESRWQNPGDEDHTFIPRLPKFNRDMGYEYYREGNQYVDTASHIRLKEVIIGYSFDDDFASKFGMSHLKLSLQATNLALITFNKWHLDPDSLLLPMQPKFTFNLTVNF